MAVQMFAYLQSKKPQSVSGGGGTGPVGSDNHGGRTLPSRLREDRRLIHRLKVAQPAYGMPGENQLKDVSLSGKRVALCQFRET